MSQLMLPGPPGLIRRLAMRHSMPLARRDSARRPCYHHLHLRHDRHSEGVMLTTATWRRTSHLQWRIRLGTKDEVSVSFLPLSHVTARHVDFALLYRGGALAYCPTLRDCRRF